MPLSTKSLPLKDSSFPCEIKLHNIELKSPTFAGTNLLNDLTQQYSAYEVMKVRLNLKHFISWTAPTIAILILCSSPCLAARLELGFNDESAQVSLTQEISPDDFNSSAVSAVFLRNTEEDTTIGSVGFNAATEIGAADGLTIGAGFKGYFGKRDDDDIASAALGLSMEFVPPALEGLGLSADIYYSPKIFTGMDADRLLERNIRLFYRMQERYDIFVSYTNIEVDIKDSARKTFDQSVRVGMSISF